MATLPTRKIGDTNYETPLNDIDPIIKALDAKKRDWAASTFGERRELALKMVPLICAETDEVAKLGVEYKGAYESKRGEEAVLWTIGEGFMWDIAETFRVLEAGEEPISRLKTLGPKADEGIIDVYPLNWFDPFLIPGKGQVYLKAGDTKPVSGKAIRERHGGPGELCVILGAGNVTALNLGDVCNKVLLDGAVAVVKVNPVNEYSGPSLERCLAPLIERGALKVVYGGAPVGKALVEHPLVESVHITGSDKTYDAIVWQGKPKSGEPALKKPITAELGCVSPVVICPGEWSDDDLKQKALEICRNVASNASCNCLANKVLVTSAAWPQREKFLEQLREGFKSLPPRFVYYPGSTEKLARFQKAYPSAETFFHGAALPEGCGPFVLNHSVSLEAAGADEPAFREEPWSTVLSEVPLKEAGTEEFLSAASEFCNERLWGTLSATLVIHPKEEKGHPEALSRFLRAMKYGTVAVNNAPAFAIMMNGAVWGAFPGSTPADIQSGNGWVRNSLCIENIEKTVVWGAWGGSKMANGTANRLEVLCKGLNVFYRELKKDGHPKWFNLVRMIFGLVTGRFL